MIDISITRHDPVTGSRTVQPPPEITVRDTSGLLTPDQCLQSLQSLGLLGAAEAEWLRTNIA